MVGFSSSYYDVNPAIIMLKGAPISHVHTLAGLRGFKLGAQIGTTSFGYITDVIKATPSPSAFPRTPARSRPSRTIGSTELVVDLADRVLRCRPWGRCRTQ